jgi:hypothetical protein
LRNNIINILKKEYRYRIEHDDKYPDFRYSISEIASEIQSATRITVGELYPILESISYDDIELELYDNPEEPDDKIISFFPIADDDLNYVIYNFRPEEFNQIKIRVINQFQKFFKRKRVKATFGKIRKGITNRTETDKSWKQIMTRMEHYFTDFSEIYLKLISGEGGDKIFNSFPKKDIPIPNLE